MAEQKIILALDAGGTNLKACLFRGSEVIRETLSSFPADAEGTLDDVRNAYRTVLTAMKAKADALGTAVEGVAVDTPGPFDYTAGISRMEHKYTAIYGVPLRPWFAEVLGEHVPLWFLHDSSAFISGAALSEGKDDRIAGVMLGTGLGFALMEKGQALVTETGSPRVSLYASPYRGGRAEDVISTRGILSAYASLSGSTASFAGAKEIADLAMRGERAALQVYADLGYALGQVIHGALAEYKTEALYLGGQISRSFTLFSDTLSAVLADIPSLVSIKPVSDPDLVHLRGAVRYWLMRQENSADSGAAQKADFRPYCRQR